MKRWKIGIGSRWHGEDGSPGSRFRFGRRGTAAPQPLEQQDYYDHFEEPLSYGAPLPWSGWGREMGGFGFDLWQFDQVTVEVQAEFRGRIAIVGSAGVGKSSLLNHLKGWALSPVDLLTLPATAALPVGEPARNGTFAYEGGLAEGGPLSPPTGLDLMLEPALEAYGLFSLIDLPATGPSAQGAGLSYRLEGVDLILFLFDLSAEVDSEVYRWLAACRQLGRPVLAVGNRLDQIPAAERESVVAAAAARLEMEIISISARSGAGVTPSLLPAMLEAAPRLAGPLGRELPQIREAAAHKIIHQAALRAGINGVQLLPTVEIPLQVANHVGLLLRIAALYGQPISGRLSRELVVTIALSLSSYMLSRGGVRAMPLVGRVGAIGFGSAATLGIGRLALHYYSNDAGDANNGKDETQAEEGDGAQQRSAPTSAEEEIER